MHPVPGYPVSTAYGKRGPYWSCSKDSAGNGVHTGADMAAPSGTPIVAARPGTVRHTSYGSAFGRYQFAVLCSDGTEDFYAHTQTRPAQGATVTAGQVIAKVGADGNVTGPHLHFERHKSQGRWSCDNCTDPTPSLTYGGPQMADEYKLDQPGTALTVGREYVRFSRDWNPTTSGTQSGKRYSKLTQVRFRSGKTIGALRFKAVRTNPTDPTWYHDEVVALDALDDAGETVRSFASFEQGDKDRNVYWMVKCVGGLSSVVISSSRYAAWSVKD